MVPQERTREMPKTGARERSLVRYLVVGRTCYCRDLLQLTEDNSTEDVGENCSSMLLQEDHREKFHR